MSVAWRGNSTMATNFACSDDPKTDVEACGTDGGPDLELQASGCHMTTAQSLQTFANLAQSGCESSAENSAPTAKKSAPPRILVVDDEPLIRWSVAETLSDCGYQVTEAHDARSAMRALLTTATATEVVLLDLRLPDSDDL